jgi:hypothetical protein
MAQGAATKDDEWQHGADTNHSKHAPDITSSSNEVLPEPLLDGGQGKRGNIDLMSSERADKFGVGATKQNDWEGNRDNGDNGTTEIMGDEQPNLFAGALHPTNSRESIRSSNTHPQINGAHLRASKLTPPPNGAIMTVNRVPNPPLGVSNDRVGTRRVRWRDPIALTLNGHTKFEGLQPPLLVESSGDLATGANTNSLWIQNKRRRHKLQDMQPPTLWWTKHTGDAILLPTVSLTQHTVMKCALPAWQPHTLPASS